MDKHKKQHYASWRNVFQEVEDILSKVHSTNYKGDPTQPGDPSFDDAVARLVKIALECGDEEVLLFNTYVANMMVFDELMSRQEAMDRAQARTN